jgi:hypothetical protein
MSFDNQLLKFIDEYRDINDGEKTARQIAAWLLAENKCKPTKQEEIDILTRHVSRVMRGHHTIDPDGRKVRQKHAVRRKIQDSDGSFKQQTFWQEMDLASPQFMFESFQQRRGSLADGAWQLDQDVTSYNKFHNKGAPLQIMLDFRDDVEERKMFLVPLNVEEDAEVAELEEDDAEV